MPKETAHPSTTPSSHPVPTIKKKKKKKKKTKPQPDNVDSQPHQSSSKQKRKKSSKKRTKNVVQPPSSSPEPLSPSPAHHSLQTPVLPTTHKKKKRKRQQAQLSEIQPATTNPDQHPSTSPPNDKPRKKKLKRSGNQISSAKESKKKKRSASTPSGHDPATSAQSPRASPILTSGQRNPETRKNKPKKKQTIPKKADKPPAPVNAKITSGKASARENTPQTNQSATNASSSIHNAQSQPTSHDGPPHPSNHISAAPGHPRRGNETQSPNCSRGESAEQRDTNFVSQTVQIIGPLTQRSQWQPMNHQVERRPYCWRTVRRNHAYKPPSAQPSEKETSRITNPARAGRNAQPPLSRTESPQDVELSDVEYISTTLRPQPNNTKRRQGSLEPLNNSFSHDSASPAKRSRNSHIGGQVRIEFGAPPISRVSTPARAGCNAQPPLSRTESPQDVEMSDVEYISTTLRPQPNNTKRRQGSLEPLNSSPSRDSASPAKHSQNSHIGGQVRIESGVPPISPHQTGEKNHASGERAGSDRPRNQDLQPEVSRRAESGRQVSLAREERTHPEQEENHREAPIRNPAETPSQNGRIHASKPAEDRQRSLTEQERRRQSEQVNQREAPMMNVRQTRSQSARLRAAQRADEGQALFNKRKRQYLQHKTVSPTGEYYGIRWGREGFSGVLTTWQNCARYTLGFSDAVYRMFDCWEKADEFADRFGTGASMNYRSNVRHIFGRRRLGPEKALAQMPWEIENEPEVVSLVMGAAWLRFGMGCGVGGYSVFVSEYNPYNVVGLLEGHVTKMRLQLKAALEALEIVHQHQLVKDGGIVELYTVSEDVKNGIDHWLGRWDRTGKWVRFGTPVVNQDIWRGILAVQKELEKKGTRIQMIWVRGPRGVPAVQKANAMARLGFQHLVETVERASPEGAS